MPAIAAFAGYDIVRGYRQAVEQTAHELDAQARVVAEQTARGIQAVDVVLRHVVEQQGNGMLSRLSGAGLRGYLKEQAVGLVQVDGLMLFNADGSVRASSFIAPADAPKLDFSAQPAFKRLRDEPSIGLMIDDSMRGPATGRWIFPIGRRLESASGQFVGAVAAGGRVDYFQQFYRDVQPDPSTRIALLHRNGTLLARHPPLESALGRPLPRAAELLATAAAGGDVPLRTASPLDGVERFGAIRMVPDYPLAIVVSRDVAGALAPWRAQATGSVLRTLALGALAALLLAAVLRQLAKLDVAHERFALAAAGSDDGIWDWDLQAETAYESRRARELQGLPLEPETQPIAELKASLTYHPDDAHRRASAMQAHLDGDTPAYEVDYRVFRDGEYRWIHVRALCIRDAAGKPVRLAGSVTDIDARMRAEVALRESEDRFAVAVAGSDDGIWVWNFVTGLAYASQRARELAGVPDAPEVQTIDAWHSQMETQMHPDDVERRRAAIAGHMDGTMPAYEAEYRMRTTQGAYRWLRVRGMCVRDVDGRPLRMAGSSTDIDARKSAEEALRESEERYALAMTGTNEGHWLWSIPEQRVYVSAKLAELLRLAGGAQEMPDADYFAGIPLHPEDAERVHRNRNNHIAGLTPRLDHEFRIVDAASGEIRWMHTRAQCFRNEHGQPLRLAGSTVEVTERKRAEMALRESEDRFAVAVAGSADGIWVWDYVAGTAFASARCREILGMADSPEVETIDEWLARMERAVHPDDRAARWLRSTRTFAADAPIYEVEYRARRLDGSYRWVRSRGTCVRDADGKPRRIAGSVTDIDARRRAEEALRESEERFAVAVAGSADGIWVFDYGAGTAYASARAREIFGADWPELQSIDDWNARMERRLEPADAVRRRAAVQAHLAGETPAYEFDYRVRERQGGYRWIRARGQCVRDAEGRPVRFAGSVSDIDEKKRAEEALRASEERFALAVAGANDGILDWDIVNDRMFASERAMRMFGLEPDDRVRTQAQWAALIMPRFHPDDVPRLKRGAARHRRKTGRSARGRIPRARRRRRVPLDALSRPLGARRERARGALVRRGQRRRCGARAGAAQIRGALPARRRRLERRAVGLGHPERPAVPVAARAAAGVRRGRRAAAAAPRMDRAHDLSPRRRRRGAAAPWRRTCAADAALFDRIPAAAPLGRLALVPPARRRGARRRRPRLPHGRLDGRHQRAQERRGRTRAARAAAAPGAEAGGDRHAGRRHRARLQQHPVGDPRLRRDGAEGAPATARRCAAISTPR